MAAPYIMSAFLGDATTLNVVMSEMLEESNSTNPDQYLIQNITTSGIINVSTVFITANLQNIVRLFTEKPHQEGTYLLTISGVLDLEKEEIDYNHNTVQYSYIIPDLILSLLSPVGGELYLNGQLKKIEWNFTTDIALNIFQTENLLVTDNSTIFIPEITRDTYDRVITTTNVDIIRGDTLDVDVHDKILGRTQYEPLLDINGEQIYDVNDDLIMVRMDNPIITIT